jgi:hypothetical protein
MPREFALFDALVPTLFLLFLGCTLLHTLLDRIMGLLGVYRLVWHPPLFRLSVFFCLFGGGGLWLLR